MHRRPPSLAAASCLAAALALLPPPSAARAEGQEGAALAAAGPGGAPLAGGDACALVEGLPTAKDPVRRAAPVRAAFKALDRAGTDPRRLAKAHARLEASVAKLLAEAQRTFHPGGPSRRWSDAQQARAQRFLRRHVLAATPVLVVGRDAFEPAPGVRAALLWTACRGGAREAAIRWGRRATRDDEGPARALAALLLLEAGREAEARALLPRLAGESFLVAWVRAELSEDATARAEAHGLARRRRTTPAQHRAVQAQAARLGAPAAEAGGGGAGPP